MLYVWDGTGFDSPISVIPTQFKVSIVSDVTYNRGDECYDFLVTSVRLVTNQGVAETVRREFITHLLDVDPAELEMFIETKYEEQKEAEYSREDDLIGREENG